MNLLFNSKPKPRPDKETNLPAFLEWEEVTIDFDTLILGFLKYIKVASNFAFFC
jgi:hypothetical protein